ncbi:amino acid ABC transporter permease [Modestobacter roseus]|uniref:amino acid ABC transporter permease n=1 Tax=Modestobacter roseus TaxID=1181884 RepID=UPI0034DE0884
MASRTGAPADTGSRPSGLEPIAPRVRWPEFVYLAVVLVLLAMLANFVVTNDRLNLPVFWEYLFHPLVLDGLRITVILTVAGMVGGTVLGLVLTAMRLSSSPTLRAVSFTAIYISRTIPLLVQLLFWFFLASVLPRISFGIPFGPEFVSFETNAVINQLGAAIIALSLFVAGYMAEIMRSGVMSVDRGQVEAATAMGMTPLAVFRRVVFPQAARISVPPTMNQVISVLKYSSVVILIGLADLMYSVQAIYSRNFQQIPLLLVATFWYGLVVVVLTVVQSQLEKRLSTGLPRAARERMKAMEEKTDA